MGGSTSVVKSKNTIQQVKPKPAEPQQQRESRQPREPREPGEPREPRESREPRDLREQREPRGPGQLRPQREFREPTSPALLEPVRCRKHFSSTVTHISETSGELICQNCYTKRKNLKDDSDCYEIEDYTRSLRFKQVETKTLDQLRNRKRALEEELKFMDYHEKRSSNKRSEMLEEIRSFVSTLVDLVKHMEDDLCHEVNKTLDGYEKRLKNQREYVQTWHSELMSVQKDINTSKGTAVEKAARVRSVLDARSFTNSMKTNAQTFNEESDYRLKMNKYITLKDIVGSKNKSGNIYLGEILKERDMVESSRAEVLPTIREAERSDETLESLGSDGTQILGSQVLSKDRRATSRAAPDNDDDRSESDGKPGFKRNHNAPANDDNEELSTISSHPNLKIVDSSEITKVAIREPSRNKMRHQFDKDRHLAGSVTQRSSSPIKPYNSRKMSTPRNSSNSIISPVSIRTPSRIQLLPTRQATAASVHGKVAMKTKTIKILTDGEIPNFTDSVILENGKIVLCDQKNERLVLLDREFKQLDEIRVRGQPHNITQATHDNKTIAVSIPDMNVIQFIWYVGDKLENPNKSIASKPKCRGLEYIDNNLLYTSRNDVVVVKAMDTEKPWKFDYSFREPVSLHADRHTNTLFVCCIGLKSAGEIIRMNFGKEKIEQVMAYAEIRHPVCCSRDGDDNLYICDIDPPRVHLVSRSGQYCRVLLDAEEGNMQHVNFFTGSDAFLVTENNSEDIHVYELR